MSSRASSLCLFSLVASMAIAVLRGQTTAPANAAFTAQAQAGRAAYDRSCANCHGPDLRGGSNAPGLTADFVNSWRTQTPRDLFATLKATMPPDAPATLSDDAYLSIVALILQQNGFSAADRLAATTATPIGSLARANQATSAATAQAPVGATPPTGRGGRGGVTLAGGDDGPQAGRGRGGAPAQPEQRGVTVEGTVKNFVPITDAMLRNPDPADWPMVRRNFQAQSYSPLNQINKDNVNNLRLAWTWAMVEGASEPSPIVYNGVIYLINPGNVIQALDARNGELIWEAHAGAENGGDMRNIAIYDDKIIQVTTDARLVALDARTGKQVWESDIAPRGQGYSSSSGPIVADGKVLTGLGGCARYNEPGCWVSAFDANTGKLLWKFDTIAQPGQPGGDTWAQPSADLPRRRRNLGRVGQLRSRSRARLLGRGAGEAVGAGQPPHVDLRQGALHELDDRGARRRRQAGLALPARARRSARSRRGLRARARRRRRQEARVLRRQARHPVEARSRRPASSSATRKRSTRTSSIGSIRRPARSPIAPTSSKRRSTSGLPPARAPPAARTGTR